MSRKEYCIRWAAEGSEKCGLSEDRVRELKQWVDFIDEKPEFSGFSENALKPLIREQDSEIKEKVIRTVSNPDMSDSTRQQRYGTERKMKAAIARYKDTNPEAVKEVKEIKPKKLWNMIEQAEYTRGYVKTMLMNGAEPASIRELVVKAIGVVEQG